MKRSFIRKDGNQGYGSGMLLTALTPILLIVLACGGIVPGTGSMDLLEGTNAALAAERIKEEIGSEKVKVIRLAIRPDRMEITIQSPDNPKHIDKYTFENGRVEGPEPVKIMPIGNRVMTADRYPHMDLDSINFESVPKMVAGAIEQMGDEKTKIDLISLEPQAAYHTKPELRDNPNSKDRLELVFTWRIWATGERLRDYYWADQDGNIVLRKGQL